MTDRRHFLIGGAAVLSTAFAPRLAYARAATDRRFVFIIQRGAADGLAMVMPTGDPGFAPLRGAWAEDAAAARKLDGMFALHPALSGMAGMYDSGRRCSPMPSPPPIATARISMGRMSSKPAAPQPMRCATAGSIGC